MDKFLGGDKLNMALAKITDGLNQAKKLDVGFMSGATYEDGTPVAMVAAIQNFGAPEANIPARPFFTNMINAKGDGWGERLASIYKGADYKGKVAFKRFGYAVASDLQQSIISTNDPALEPSTIAAKGFSKALIDTGHMINSVTFNVDGSVLDLPKINAGSQ
jgi:hypothetical protein